jgi:hypothetical protein
LSSGPAAGAAMLVLPGIFTCVGENGTGRVGPAPCPPASVIKVDPSGNKIWGTLLGGPTADIGTALAVATDGNVAFTGSTGGQFPTTPGAAIRVQHQRHGLRRQGHILAS